MQVKHAPSLVVSIFLGVVAVIIELEVGMLAVFDSGHTVQPTLGKGGG